MSYWVSVQLEKVVCREPESLTTDDLFALYGVIFTDTGSKAFHEPIQSLGRGEHFSYGRVVYDGFTEAPTIAILVRAWDKDNNSLWINNKDDVKKVIDDVEQEIKHIPVVGDIAGFIADAAHYMDRAISTFVAHDLDDLLVSREVLVPLSAAGVPGQPHTQTIEIRFSRSDPTGYSDWDYSLFYIVSSYQTIPSLGRKIPAVWEACREPSTASEPANWIGRWGSSTTPSVLVEISRSGKHGHLMNVSVKEYDRSTNTEVVVETKAVPISRIFVEVGYLESGPRTLESAGAFVPTTVELWDSRNRINPSLPGADPFFKGVPDAVPPNAAVTRFNIEKLVGTRTVVKEPLFGAAIEATNVLTREQIGADFLWLNNQALLEIYRILGEGQHTGEFALMYLRPVHPLYRDTGAQIAAPLQWLPL
jgi:hypothetical protein